MNTATRAVLSVLLSFVMLFLLGAQPHTAHASQKNPAISEHDQRLTQQNSDSPTVNPEESIAPEIVPLVLAPVAAVGITWTIVDSIFAASLGYYVGTQAQDLFKGSVNDKQNSSTVHYSFPTYTQTYPSYPDFAGYSLGTKATKHMEEAMVVDVHNRIKNYGDGSNLRVYSSTKYAYSIMSVIDIKSDLGGVVNRHLGNFLDGSIMKDPNFQNEWMNLSGYSLFIITNKSTGQIFHAHFTPTWLRDREIEYNRYVGQFDVQIFPFNSRNSKYIDNGFPQYQTDKNNAMYNRGLLKDTKGNTSVISYK